MSKKILRCRKFSLDLSDKTCVMGVLNITPDSFSDGGKFLDVNSARRRALEMQRDGADIIDIGGESSRPGSARISACQEIERVIPVVRALKGKLKIPISIDTMKAVVAEAALKEGASIINDISGLRNDASIAGLCAKYSAGLIVMHMKGTPQTMQQNPRYRDLLKEVKLYLRRSVRIALDNGLRRDNLVIDPGIGFGKTLSDNIAIIKGLSSFRRLGLPVLIGLSRKSFLGEITALDVGRRLIPTIAANAIAVYSGADIIRAHDVAEAVIASKIAKSFMR